jgi:flagellar biosynthesis protein FlhG
MVSNDLKPQQSDALQTACACLFSKRDLQQDRFWEQLDLGSVKRAYRNKALRFHPDRMPHGKLRSVFKGNQDFIQIHESYRVLCTFLQSRKAAHVQLPAQKVIAVGGSKGGVGKSIISTNLGVLLANTGKQVVLIDLDIQGANLHLYMNQVRPHLSLDDFLQRRATRLEDTAVTTSYGPRLIAGSHQGLGLRQLTFTQKMNIIKGIGQIQADYVIMDLGGNTSFNTLDFFNSADYGIVVSTCDPAAYLEAINFTCAAFYRYLSRAFANESPWRLRKQTDLENLIHAMVNHDKLPGHRPMWQLVQKVKAEQPHNLQLLRDIVGGFNAHLAINAVSEGDAAREIAAHVCRASRKILFAKMNYLGHLASSEAIARSARSFVPVVRTDPDGNIARKIKNMLSRLDV